MDKVSEMKQDLGIDTLYTNTTKVYAQYISGHYTRFHSKKSEAEASANDHNNGTWFNHTWFQAKYDEIAPGDLLSDGYKVWLKGDSPFDVLATKSDMPETHWKVV